MDLLGKSMSPATPPTTQDDLKDQKIIFKYKNAKIVKSRRDNKILAGCSPKDLKHGIVQAFWLKEENRRKKKERDVLDYFERLFLRLYRKNDIPYLRSIDSRATIKSSDCVSSK